MEKTKEESVSQKNTSDIYQHEDGVLKVAVHFFAEELLPYLKIEGKVVDIAPTEVVYLELHKMFQDFNLVMEDGSWKHFEFQSTDGGVKDLKRFRMYEAATSYQNEVEVITYVLYSGKIKQPQTEYAEGINTYRVNPIILQNDNADEVIEELLMKVENGERVTKEELVPLILTPLMSGKMDQKERILASFEITGKVSDVSKEDIQKIEAMVYAMADKFLEKVEMEELKEGLMMTRLGTMLVNEGIQQGIERGIENAIKLCKDLGVSKEDAILRIGNLFEKNEEDAKQDIEKYWD